MKAGLFEDPTKEHHRRWLERLGSGLRRRGVDCAWFDRAELAETFDFVACWGWRLANQIPAAAPVLVLECGYLGARTTEWISLGWNGLNGRADFCTGRRWGDVAGDRAERWLDHLKPCRDFGAGSIVIMGQVAGDQSWNGTDPDAWFRGATDAARAYGGGRDVVFRPHPLEPARFEGIQSVIGSLEATLADAAGVITFNSNAGVDAVLAGVPTIAWDRGSMVWELCPSLPPFQRIDEDARMRWLEHLAYCQWTAAELADGTAWDHIGKGMAYAAS